MYRLVCPHQDADFDPDLSKPEGFVLPAQYNRRSAVGNDDALSTPCTWSAATRAGTNSAPDAALTATLVEVHRQAKS